MSKKLIPDSKSINFQRDDITSLSDVEKTIALESARLRIETRTGGSLQCYLVGVESPDIDLSEIIIGAVRGGADYFLDELKRRVPTYAYFSIAGAMDVRAVLRPQEDVVSNATENVSNDTKNKVGAPPLETSDSRTGMAIGVSFAVLFFFFFGFSYRAARIQASEKRDHG